MVMHKKERLAIIKFNFGGMTDVVRLTRHSLYSSEPEFDQRNESSNFTTPLCIGG